MSASRRTCRIGLGNIAPERLRDTRNITVFTGFYFEIAETMEMVIARAKQLKRDRRDWKRNLIERQNPAWNDLGAAIGLDPLPSPPATR